MAVHSRHPAGAPPRAPARESTGHLLLRAYATVLLFIALATTFWYNLIGPVGLFVLVTATVVASVAVWISTRPVLDSRRLPWLSLAYVVWAAVSAFWSHWPDATALTWAMLAATTFQGVFLAAVLTWRELVRAVDLALKGVLAGSLLFELWVSLIVRHPVLPDFFDADGGVVTEVYWSRNNLFDVDGRIQGIVGNAHLLAIAALLGGIVVAVRMAALPRRRGWQVPWLVLAALLFWRAASGTAYLALGAVAVVLATVLLMRTTRHAGERTKYYLLYAGVGIALVTTLIWGRDLVLGALGKTADLTGRVQIWSAVWERAVEHPVIGWGFSTPWVPWEPEFAGWIIVNDLTVFHAHNMWLDAFFQLGAVGVVLLVGAYAAFVWRAWFFAIDRPRWDLVATRPYQSLTLLPTLIATVLLVQGLAESRPLMEWGWLFLVMLSTKLKQAPLVGEGPAERSLAMERGEPVGETR